MNTQKANNNSKVYQTILVLVTALVTCYFIFKQHNVVFLKAALILALIGIFSLTVAKWIHIGWMKFAQVLGTINSYILMSIIFYIILLPIALLYRLTNKSARFSTLSTKKSSFHERNHTYEAKDLANVW